MDLVNYGHITSNRLPVNGRNLIDSPEILGKNFRMAYSNAYKSLEIH